jgi:hypothetical protein
MVEEEEFLCMPNHNNSPSIVAYRRKSSTPKRVAIEKRVDKISLSLIIFLFISIIRFQFIEISLLFLNTEH